MGAEGGPRRLVIIGGGPSGLAAAWGAREAAEAAGRPLQIVVLEARDRVGGRARSPVIQGFTVEEGPNGFLDSEPALGHLIARAGLGDARILADGAAARRYLVREGRPVEIPAHPLRFLRSGILSPRGMLRLMAEPLLPRKRADQPESVFAFGRRRLGEEAAERLLAPMVSGVFAGDADRLSVAHAFPRLVAMESEHGSLLRGLIHLQRAKRLTGPGGPSGALTSFEGGIEAFPRGLAAKGDFEVRLNARVADLERAPEGGYLLRLEGEGAPLKAQGVILAGEAYAMAPLVRGVSAPLSDALASLDFPPLTVVALAFDGAAARGIPPGFGLLAPPVEGRRILGCLFETQVFPGRGPAGQLLIRVMVGGATARALGELEDDALLPLVREELAGLLGLHAAPLFTHVARWPRAIPQYDLDHGGRIAAAEAALKALPGLEVAGNGLFGIAFAKAVARGYEVGGRLGGV